MRVRPAAVEQRKGMTTGHGVADLVGADEAGPAEDQDAERLLTEAFEGKRKVLGEEHQETLRTIGSLGHLYRRQGKLDQAEQLLAQCCRKSREVLGEEHVSTIQPCADLGIVYYRQGKIDEAQALFAKLIEIMRRVLGDDSPTTLDTTPDVGVLHLVRGRDVEAELQEGIEFARSSPVPAPEEALTDLYVHFDYAGKPR